MSQRKLQQEIDRIFKKVKEGLEEFDFIYNKFQDCDNQSQKEKIESDLKKEIKKLQRHREQIKNWISGNEVKDKTALMEHRRLIEVEMERFKEVEKAMKTKAFSNEALAATSENLDPRKKEKLESAEFMQANIEELERQIEAFEVRLDSLTSTKKKKIDTTKLAQLNSINDSLSRHKWHIDMLETVLRHLENDNIDVEQINDIKDDIEYYVESNQEPGFVEDDTFYDVLGLDDMEDSFAVIPNDEQIESTPPPFAAQQPPSSAPATVSTPTSASSSIKKTLKKREELQRSQTESNVPSLASQLQQTHLNNNTTLSSMPKLVKSASTIGSYAAATLAPTPTPLSALPTTVSNNFSSPANTPSLSAATILKPATPIGTPKLKYSAVASQALQQSASKKTTNSNLNTPVQSFVSLNGENKSSIPSTPINTKNNNTNSVNLTTQNSTINMAQPTYFAGNLKTSLSFTDDSFFDKLPGQYSQYVKSLDVAKNRMLQFKEQESFHVPSKKYQPPPPICELRLPLLKEIMEQLETSLLTCPDSHDSDLPMNYEPMNPYVTQLSYPMDPLMELNSTKIMEKLELDTLAYCFYYHSLQMPSQYTPYYNDNSTSQDRKSYVQWLAAEELKRRNWSYYKDQHSWFQRDEEDNGNFKTFDYKDAWLVRHQGNFQPNESTKETNY